MRIALATCSNLPSWEVDDRALFAAFAGRGMEAVAAVWDDSAMDWRRFDAVLIRTTWDYMDKRPAFVQWAHHVEAVTRLFNPASVVDWNTQKTYLRDLESRGVHIAPTVWLECGKAVNVAEVMREHRWERGFIKPVIGATARETLRFDVDANGLHAAQAHLNRTLAREDMMLQPYLAKVEHEGERSVIFIDGIISHAVQKIPVKGDYRVQDDFGARDFPIQLTDDQKSLAQATVDAARSCTGAELLYARCDYLLDNDGRWTLTELELVEPSLFFRHQPDAAMVLADAVGKRVYSD